MPKPPPPQPPAGLSPATPGEWMHAWVRVRATPAVKLVGAMAAYFADYGTGADIRPGTVILAAVSGEMNPRTVKIALAQIREWRLIWRYSEGSKQGRRGLADVYRLTIPDDVLDTVPMLSPELHLPVDKPPDQVISEHVISEHVLSGSGTGDLRYRNR